jgi:acyl-CoA oxidase
VQISALSEKPAYALDNAVTRFDRVRVPKANLLAGADSVLHDDGRFETRTPSRHQRFLRTIDRVQTGRICFTSSVVSSLRAATWIAMRYTAQRLTFGPGRRNVPLIAYRNVQRDVFGALASAYALTFAVRRVQERFQQRTTETEQDCFRLVAVIKAIATSETARTLARLRERCGASGMFTANRIIEFWNQAQGVITAEGDNQLMLLKVGGQLATEASRPIRARPVWAHPAPLLPELCLELLRFREHRLQEELRTSMARRTSTADAFSWWNDEVSLVLAAAEAHGDRVIVEGFVAAVNAARDEATRCALATLCSLWSVGRIERHAGWFLAEACVTARTVGAMRRVRDALCAETALFATALVAGFEMDNSLLQAPIAEDDYVRAYVNRSSASL